MIYITGDTHRDFYDIEEFCKHWETTANDMIIILGDAGINYYGHPADYSLKLELSRLPITLFCIHGNHEMRPESIPSYKEIDTLGAVAYAEPDFPNLLFAKDGEIYTIGGRKCIAIGGANSVDKHLRTPGVDWWDDEQPDDAVKAYVEQNLEAAGWEVDAVLSHTCPYNYMPREAFLVGGSYDKSVDSSTEKWLDEIEQRLDYGEWYCGHFHTEKYDEKIRFLFNSIDEFEEE